MLGLMILVFMPIFMILMAYIMTVVSSQPWAIFAALGPLIGIFAIITLISGYEKKNAMSRFSVWLDVNDYEGRFLEVPVYAFGGSAISSAIVWLFIFPGLGPALAIIFAILAAAFPLVKIIVGKYESNKRIRGAHGTPERVAERISKLLDEKKMKHTKRTMGGKWTIKEHFIDLEKPKLTIRIFQSGDDESNVVLEPREGGKAIAKPVEALINSKLM